MTVRVVGVGNILYRDEGVGIFAARHLRQAYRFEPEIEIADGALLGFGLMDLFDGDGVVVVLDALLADAEPGTVYRLPTERLLELGGDVTPTAHEVDPIQLLKRTRALGGNVEMVLLGIVPADASGLSVGLTPVLAEAFPRLIEAVLAELRALGVQVERVSSPSLDDVIEALSTRTVA